MKRFLYALVLMLAVASASYGSEPQEIYVRKDVFDARMEAFFARMDNNIAELSAKINQLDAKISNLNDKVDQNFTVLNDKIDKNYAALNDKIDKNYAALNDKIDRNYAALNDKIDVVSTNANDRISDLRNGIYLWMVFLGIIFSLPFISKWFENRKSQVASITREEFLKVVERLDLLQAQLGR